MPSLTQAILDRMNGIPDEDKIPFPPAKSQNKPKASKVQREPLTEGEKITHNAIKNMLRVGIWMVDFEKVNGLVSTMECTLDPRHIPYDPNKINVAEPKEDHVEDLIHVYALDRQGWRSFVSTKVLKLYKKPEQL